MPSDEDALHKKVFQTLKQGLEKTGEVASKGVQASANVASKTVSGFKTGAGKATGAMTPVTQLGGRLNLLFILVIIIHLIDIFIFLRTETFGSRLLLIALPLTIIVWMMLFNYSGRGFFIALIISIVQVFITPLGGFMPGILKEFILFTALLAPLWGLIILIQYAYTKFLKIIRVLYIIFLILFLITTYGQIGNIVNVLTAPQLQEAAQEGANFIDRIKEAVVTTPKLFFKALTQDFYIGQVDENQDEPLGIYIENLQKTSPKFYEGESISVWARVSARTLDNSKPIDLDVSCYAKSGLKQIQGDAWPENTVNKVYSFDLINNEERVVTCSFDDGLVAGTWTVYFKVNFNFNTMSYQKIYMMDLVKRRALQVEDVDPYEFYSIEDRTPVTIYTNGPIGIGMYVDQPLLGITPNGASTIRMTISNQWDGKVKQIDDVTIKVPEFTNFYCTNAPFKENRCIEDECEGGKYTKVYRLEKTTSGLSPVLNTIKDIGSYYTFACRFGIDDMNKLLGNVPVATKYFKLITDYSYELEKSISIVVEKSTLPLGEYNLRPTESESIKAVYKSKAVIINSAADKYNIDPYLITAIIYSESRGNEYTKDSSTGAVGLMQVMPKFWAKKCGISESELRIPEKNVMCGTYILKEELKRFNGDYYKAIAAYNAGSPRVNEWIQDGSWEQWESIGRICCSEDCRKVQEEYQILFTTTTCETQNYIPKTYKYYMVLKESGVTA